MEEVVFVVRLTFSDLCRSPPSAAVSAYILHVSSTQCMINATCEPIGAGTGARAPPHYGPAPLVPSDIHRLHTTLTIRD